MTTYTNDGYTSLFTEINFSEVSTVLRELPWYSSRIEPLITSVLAAEDADASVSYHVSTRVETGVVTEVHTNVYTRQAGAASNDTMSAAASDSDMSAATPAMNATASDDTASSADVSATGSAADSTAASEVVTVISGVTVTVPATELSALGLASASVTGLSNGTMSAASYSVNGSTVTVTSSGSAMSNMTNTTGMSGSARSSASDRTETRTSTHHDGANLLTAGLGAMVAGAVALLL